MKVSPESWSEQGQLAVINFVRKTLGRGADDFVEITKTGLGIMKRKITSVQTAAMFDVKAKWRRLSMSDGVNN